LLLGNSKLRIYIRSTSIANSPDTGRALISFGSKALVSLN